MAGSAMKDAIVVRNEFTSKLNSAKGATPGLYLVRYASRTSATEELSPEMGDDALPSLERYLMRYVVRDNASEQAKVEYEHPMAFSDNLHKLNGLDGRAFGDKGVAYSGSLLQSEAKHVQDLFDKGHVILKTIVSFRTEYLQAHGVIPADFVPQGRGSLKGQVDQLKLRHAVNNGVALMTRRSGFVDPTWCGAVQVDTNHVHAHLVIAEQSGHTDRLATNGEERGEINSYEKDLIRTGINNDLRDMSRVKSLHSQVDINRRDYVSKVRDVALNEFETSAKLQQIVASLPKDKRLWRYNSNALIMEQPNHLMDDYLFDMTHRHRVDKSYQRAVFAISNYANLQQSQNHLTGEETTKIRQNGLKLLQTRLANTVYSSIKQYLKDKPLTTDTSYIEAGAKGLDELRQEMVNSKATGKNSKTGGVEAEDESVLEMNRFLYRLGSHKRRYQEYSKAEDTYDELIKDYDKKTEEATNVNPQSVALRMFYISAHLYNARLSDKYRFFFNGGHKNDKEKTKRFLLEQRTLENDYRRLQDQADDKIDDRANKLVDRLLYDNGLEGVRSLSVDPANPDGETMTDALRRYQRTGVLSKSAQTFLNELGRQRPVYADAGNVLKAQQETGNKILSSDYLKDSAMTYVDDLADYYDRRRHAGLLRGEDLFDAKSVKADLLAGTLSVRDLPKPAVLRPSDDLLNNDYFNRIKALDLHDLTYDFDPHQKRTVDPKYSTQYLNEVRGLQTSLGNAQHFMSSTGQHNDYFDKLSDKLDQHVDFGKTVQQIDAIPEIDDRQKFTALTGSRQLKTIAVKEADDQTRDTLQLFSDVQNDVARDYFERSRKVAEVEDVPDDEVEDTQASVDYDNDHQIVD